MSLRTGFAPPRGPSADRVDVYSRDIEITSQEVDGTAESLVDSDVRCKIGTVQSLGLDSVFGMTTKKESAIVFGREPTIKAGYRLEMADDATQIYMVERVERLPHEHRWDMQVAFLASDLRTA